MLNQRNQFYKIAGRITGIREHGKSIFITVHDPQNKMQSYIKQNENNRDIFELIQNILTSEILLNFRGLLQKTNENT